MQTVRITFPDDVGGGEIVLKEPTTQIEIDAEKAARVHDAGLTGNSFELLKRCAVSILGQPVDWSKGSPDKMLDELGPVRRQLAISGFNKAFNPTPEQRAAFLQTMKWETST